MIPCQTYNKSNHVKSKIILQQIKRIESALDCQKFCSYYYADQCTWWLYDEKNNYCKIFKGPQQDIFDDCFELGFSSFPSISECKTVGDPHSNDNCQVNILIYIYSLCTSLKLFSSFEIQILYRQISFSFSDKITVDTRKIFWTIWNTPMTWILANGLVKKTRCAIFLLSLRIRMYACYIGQILESEYAT